MRFLAAAALALVLAMGCSGCHPSPPPVTPPPPTLAGDAAPATCLDLCRHGSDLGCAWAHPTPAGATCTDVCVNNQSGPAPWDLGCRSAAGSCDAIDRCQ